MFDLRPTPSWHPIPHRHGVSRDQDRTGSPPGCYCRNLVPNLVLYRQANPIPPKSRSKAKLHKVILPLAAVRENDLAQYAQLRAFPIIPCDLCGSHKNLKRKQVKEFLCEWEQRSPGCTDSTFAALSNVAPPLLLDDGCSTSRLCAHPIRRRGRKTAG